VCRYRSMGLSLPSRKQTKATKILNLSIKGQIVFLKTIVISLKDRTVPKFFKRLDYFFNESL